MNKENIASAPRNGRIEALDVLRGLTVAGMILVNNGYGDSFDMLRHSRWNGLTPCDLVFPFFLFIMGISCYLSLSKTQFLPSRPTLMKILKRSALLFLLGLLLNWFEMAMKGHPADMAHLRLWGVMQRIALCYLAASLFAVYVHHRYTLPTIALLLAGYTALLLAGNGYDEDATTNILAQADLRLFGYDHLYHKSPVDPEGLLGTIAGTAHVLIGFWCGRIIKRGRTIEEKIIGLFAVGTVCVVGGYLLTFGLPLNKRIWSPSYVLVTCGMAALLQALLIRAEQAMAKGDGGMPVAARRLWRVLTRVCVVFGMNALAIYMASELLSTLFAHLGIATFIYDVLHTVVAPLKWASLAYALTFVAINYALGYLLWRRRIFIKL